MFVLNKPQRNEDHKEGKFSVQPFLFYLRDPRTSAVNKDQKREIKTGISTTNQICIASCRQIPRYSIFALIQTPYGKFGFTLVKVTGMSQVPVLSECLVDFNMDRR